MNKYKPSNDFLASVGVLLLSFLIIQGIAIPNTYNTNQTASVAKAFPQTERNIYNITPSKEVPGAFNFDYVYAKTSGNQKEVSFDAPIIPFNDAKARQGMKESVDFGPVRDLWGYPVRENAYMSLKELPKAKELSSKSNNVSKKNEKKNINKDIEKIKEEIINKTPSTTGTLKNLDASSNLGMYNCRANTSVTGYFKAYFEDVALDNNIGFDHPTYGEARRQVACQALQDLSELIKLDTTTVTPDIIFMRSDTSIPPGVLAGASAYFAPKNPAIANDGMLHDHIISHQDTSPGAGQFDALVITNFNLTPPEAWNPDVPFNTYDYVYDLYTTLTHEMMHTLGFRGLLPAVISQTNTPQTHTTFDTFTYKDSTLSNPFIDTTNSNLEVPIGAPSPWFTTNSVVYQGVKNIVNATPDNTDPIYSPPSWQQGSSLSHFDMNRAPGEVFVMNPSSTPNVAMSLHDDEKDVLCQLGYMVSGLAGCEVPSPWAVDDFVVVDGTDPVCINLLENDINSGGSLAFLRVNTFESMLIQPGDIVEYLMDINCNGTLLQSSSGARSIRLTPISPSPRVFEYTNISINSDRVSLPAMITIMPSCESIVDPDEYVCNGDFMLRPLWFFETTSAFICPSWNLGSRVPFWCQYWGSPDIEDTFEGPVVRFVSGQNFKEAPMTRLKYSLVAGQEYRLTFDAAVQGSVSTPSPLFVGLNMNTPVTYPTSHTGSLIPSPDQIILNTLIPPANLTSFTSFEIVFVPNDNYGSLMFLGGSLPGPEGQRAYYLRNASIKPLGTQSPYLNLISGTVYQDLNQNGLWNTQIEPGLPGLQVGLFQSGNQTPIQTVTTEDIPNQGKYSFTNLVDGTYYTALLGETLFPQITEPGVSSDPLTNYNHVHTITVANGQTSNNNNFGVVLQDAIPGCTTPSAFNYNPEATIEDDSCIPVISGCTDPTDVNYNPLANTDDGSCAYNTKADIQVSKSLLDGTLSPSDPLITWRVKASNYSQYNTNTTNIQIKDAMPPEFTYVDHSTPTGTYTVSNANIGVWNIPYLGANQTTYIDIRMKVPPTSCGTKTNYAQLVTLDQSDSDASNNYSLSSIHLPPCSSTPNPTGTGIYPTVRTR